MYNPKAILRERSQDEEPAAEEATSPAVIDNDATASTDLKTSATAEAESSTRQAGDESMDELQGGYGMADQSFRLLPEASGEVNDDDMDLADFDSQLGEPGPVATSVDGGLADDTERLSISGSDADGAIVNASDLAMRAQSQRPPRSKSDAPAMDETEGQTVESDRKDVKTKQQEPKEDMKIWGSDQ